MIPHYPAQKPRIDSLGSATNEHELFRDYDKDQIRKFKESILLKNNAYYVDLPWLKDKIKPIPSNYQVSLKVLIKTMNYLRTKNLNKYYNQAFY